MTSMIAMKRGYAPADPEDGIRVLVDRLWLRGVSKEHAHLDAWMKDLGPSTEVRKWFGHRAERWEEFQRRYREELREPSRQTLLALLQTAAASGHLTLVYGAADTERNAAVVIRDAILSPPAAPTVDPQQALRLAWRAIAAAHPRGEAAPEQVLPFVGALVTPEAIAEALGGQAMPDIAPG